MVPEALVAVAANDVKFLLGRLNQLTIDSLGSRGAVGVIGWERAVAVGALGFRRAVESRGTRVLVHSSTAVAAARVPGTLRGVAETLATRVMSADRRLFVDAPRVLAGAEEFEGFDRVQEGHDPSQLASPGVGSMFGGADVDRRDGGLCSHLLRHNSGIDFDHISKEIP